MPTRHNPDTMPSPASNYAQLVEVEAGARTVYLSGQVGIADDGSTPDDFAVQCELAFGNLDAGLRAVGMSLDDVVRFNAYVTDAADIGTFRAVRDRLIAGDPTPASTLVVVAALAAPQWKVEIECVAATA